MSEVWQYGIPITITAAGLVSLWLYQHWSKSELWRPLAYYHLGNGLLLILAALNYIHVTATSPLLPSTGGTRAAYLLGLVAVMLTLLYALILGMMRVIQWLGSRRWRK